MMDRENILVDFIISSLSETNAATDYIYIQAKDILPVENLIENMIWTLIDKTTSSHTILQVSMGFIFLNLSQYAELINRDIPDSFELNLLFSILTAKKKTPAGCISAGAYAIIDRAYHRTDRLRKQQLLLSEVSNSVWLFP